MNSIRWKAAIILGSFMALAKGYTHSPHGRPSVAGIEQMIKVEANTQGSFYATPEEQEQSVQWDSEIKLTIEPLNFTEENIKIGRIYGQVNITAGPAISGQGMISFQAFKQQIKKWTVDTNKLNSESSLSLYQGEGKLRWRDSAAESLASQYIGVLGVNFYNYSELPQGFSLDFTISTSAGLTFADLSSPEEEFALELETYLYLKFKNIIELGFENNESIRYQTEKGEFLPSNWGMAYGKALAPLGKSQFRLIFLAGIEGSHLRGEDDAPNYFINSGLEYSFEKKRKHRHQLSR